MSRAPRQPDPRPADPLLAALLPALHLATELVAALDRAIDRRDARWTSLLVSSVLDDAARLHNALGQSLERVRATLTPELMQAMGLAEPKRDAKPSPAPERLPD